MASTLKFNHDVPCDSCKEMISKGELAVLVGENNVPWCEYCAAQVGIPIELEDEDE